MSKQILIIKFGAIGDVLRTTPILAALKIKYPASRITWLTDHDSYEVLGDNDLIDTLVGYTPAVIDRLKQRRLDLSICLDKEAEALSAMMLIPAKEKKGLGLNEGGALIALDQQSDYAVKLGMDDDLKFRQNQKSYQQISFEQAGLRFNQEPYFLKLSQQDRNYAQKVFDDLDLNTKDRRHPIVGIHTGSGHRFAGKKLPIDSYVGLSEKLTRDAGYRVALLGGKQEQERNKIIEQRVSTRVVNSGGGHTIKQYAALAEHCDLIISGDTLAMHVAIAMKRPVLVFFASTCGAEIELYGRGEKLISTIDCSPCYLKQCPIDEQCMKDFSVDLIYQRAVALLSLKSR